MARNGTVPTISTALKDASGDLSRTHRVSSTPGNKDIRDSRDTLASPWWWLIFPVLQLAALVITGVCQSLLAGAPYNESAADWQLFSNAVAYLTLPLTMAFTALVVPYQDCDSARICRWTTIAVSLIQTVIGIVPLSYFASSADNVAAQIAVHAVHAVYLLLQAGLAGWWIAVARHSEPSRHNAARAEIRDHSATSESTSTETAASRLIRPSSRTWLTLLLIPALLTVATIIWLAVAGIESGSVLMAFFCLGLFLAVMSAPMTAISGLLVLQGRRRHVAFWVPVGEIVFLSVAHTLVSLARFQDYTQETMVYAPVAIILLAVSTWLPIWLAKPDKRSPQADPRR